MREDALRSIAAFIKENDDFTVVAHTTPDGDTLGASLALYGVLVRIGKRAAVVCEQPVPHTYAFLPGAEHVLLPEDARQTEHVIAVDCADRARMGAALRLFDGALHTCNIDHHPSNDFYAELNAVDDMAAATGELIASLAEMLLPELDAPLANCLYTALMTDTGNFAYSNTRPETFHLAGRLLAAGADNAELNRLVYRTVPFAKQKLLGRALANMELLFEGKLGVSYVMQSDFAATGASEEDTEGIIDHVRDVEGVEAALLLRETPSGAFKLSLRSKKAADVGAVAQAKGGGGHKHAAGYTAEGPFDLVRAEAVTLCERALREVWKEL